MGNQFLTLGSPGDPHRARPLFSLYHILGIAYPPPATPGTERSSPGAGLRQEYEDMGLGRKKVFRKIAPPKKVMRKVVKAVRKIPIKKIVSFAGTAAGVLVGGGLARLGGGAILKGAQALLGRRAGSVVMKDEAHDQLIQITQDNAGNARGSVYEESQIPAAQWNALPNMRAIPAAPNYENQLSPAPVAGSSGMSPGGDFMPTLHSGESRRYPAPGRSAFREGLIDPESTPEPESDYSTPSEESAEPVQDEQSITDLLSQETYAAQNEGAEPLENGEELSLRSILNAHRFRARRKRRGGFL